MTAVRLKLPPNPLVVVTELFAPCYFVSGASRGFDIYFLAPQHYTKKAQRKPPSPGQLCIPDDESPLFIAIHRSTHSKRQRLHISVLFLGSHTRLLSNGRIADRMNWLSNAIDHSAMHVRQEKIERSFSVCVDVLD